MRCEGAAGVVDERGADVDAGVGPVAVAGGLGGRDVEGRGLADRKHKQSLRGRSRNHENDGAGTVDCLWMKGLTATSSAESLGSRIRPFLEEAQAISERRSRHHKQRQIVEGTYAMNISTTAAQCSGVSAPRLQTQSTPCQKRP